MRRAQVSPDISRALAADLPFLRRYARALCGEQAKGDWFALRALQAIMDGEQAGEDASTPKIRLFKAFMSVWHSDAFDAVIETELKAAVAQSYLRKLTSEARQALLLHANEEFTVPEVAEILGLSVDDADHLILQARNEIRENVKGSVLIIEDEAMIAMDLDDITTDLGHHVTGTAPTRSQAVALAQGELPDLILSDIKLADGSSGVDAVNEILEAAAEIPVIFITAFPELLLTGERMEPAFVITKPYTEEQVESAISQAMFFRSTAAIEA
ncbi:response regulator [Yoonia sediminilitoris]|uniref:Sigma-70-like protein n=1 Tax=Yoonia sediminilitoris TaxID=1286148 RepID=A0A2T6KB18_9RHOB|nr:response regulator [Yoonia sediminilitoris]PUB12076.1 sigma-70-like protein [Yoonia sediminilitoris]RCW92903.1 sigma-70-like protein [Yoonia sediminilitoris]